MPKVNHNRAFRDERDYTVPGDDWACGKHGHANQRRGAKKGKNRNLRANQNQVTKQLVTGDDEAVLIPKAFKTVGKAHDHNGKSLYVTYNN